MQIDQELWMEKINLENKNHIWLLDTLAKENPAPQSFIWNFKKDILERTDNYLERSGLLYSPFALWAYDYLIGYLEISKVFYPEKYVELVYAILNHEEQKGLRQSYPFSS